MIREHFRDFARYNRWANARLYTAAYALDDEQRRRDLGLYFRSVHGTFNHLLVTDRIWLARLTGDQPEPGPLDRILHECDDDLIRARIAEDERILTYIDSLDDAAFAQTVTYRNMAGTPFTQVLQSILTHVFNHQTHHRSQAHTGLSLLGVKEPPSLDLVVHQRGDGAPDLHALISG